MQGPISEVGTLIEPDPVIFSFGAPGWYVILVLSLITITWLSWIYFDRKRRNHYRKVAIGKINDLTANQHEPPTWEINKLLKRICINKYGRKNCADLTGQEWLDFLNDKCKTPVFDQEATQAYYGIYDKSDRNSGPFLKASINWIRNHEL